MLPELQGRLPIRVELDALTSEDFKRILKEPDNSLIKQYKALLNTEKVDLEFTDDGLSFFHTVGNAGNNNLDMQAVYRYDLTSPFDITAATQKVPHSMRSAITE